MKSMAKTLIVFFVTVGILFFASALPATDRSEVKQMHKWNLKDYYPSDEAFEKEKEQVVKGIEKMSQYKGTLAQSGKQLFKALEFTSDLEMKMRKLESYTSRRLDRDTRVSENLALQSEVEAVRTNLAEAASFIDPEITKIDEGQMKKFFSEEPGLKVYDFPIREIMRMKAHIRNEAEEEILAAAYDLYYTNETVYSIFTNADMPKKTITLADGTEIKMTYPNFDKVRRSLVEQDRKAAFEAFTSQYKEYVRTMAQTLFGQLKVHKFYTNMRHYDSTLEAALDRDEIDVKIYTSLIEAAHKHLDTFHRYLKLKARALGKEKLHYTDMYIPFTTGVEISVDYEQAQKMLLEALVPLGSEYVDKVKEAFEKRWVDVYPNEGKRNGAYSSGWAYDVHPFILMNFNDTYSDTLTLAHEFGHAMHSHYSNSNQPFPTADYATFVAEVASTFNENLLNDYMLKKVENDDEKLYLLGNFLDGTIKGTFFRQIQFAEYELMMHKKVEKGEALTDEVLSEMYLDLTRLYYGHDEGVVEVPEMIAVEWSMIPHFYYNYYVFTYSTSVAAASLLAQKVIEKEPGALEKYYANLLKAGGSTGPVDILKNAGADMTTPEAYKALIDRANRYMDEVEKLLDAKGM